MEYKLNPIPADIDNPKLNQLLSKLNLTNTPQKIQYKEFGLQDKTECIKNVEKVVEINGGYQLFGWAIWLTPNVLIEAEFHSAWMAPESIIYDVTPRGFREILFIIDRNLKFNGYQIDNIRIPLTPFKQIEELISNSEEYFQILNKGNRKFEFGKIRLELSEIERVKSLQAHNTKLVKEICERNNNPKRNSICFCGSEKKYKHCCERKTGEHQNE
ncbi:SEC-C domain-containing protein [Leptospira sp. 96542]|nr:SEC-C domain-containing protein [Leptospira sp. 96542]